MKARNVHSLHLDVSSLSEYNVKVCLLPAVMCVGMLPRLRRVTVELPQTTMHRCDDPYDQSGCVSDLVEGFNRDLGARGRLMSVGMGGREEWFWEVGSCRKGEE